MGLAVLVVLALRAIPAMVTVGAAQPGAPAAVGAVVDGQVVHRCSLSDWSRRQGSDGGVAALHPGIVVTRNVVRHVNCDPTAHQRRRGGLWRVPHEVQDRRPGSRCPRR